MSRTKVAFCTLAVSALMFVAVPSTARAHDEELSQINWFGVAGPYEGSLIHLTPAGFPPLRIRMAFYADGNFMEAHMPFQVGTPVGDILLTPSIGAWIQIDAHTFKASFAQDAEGGPGNSMFAGQPIGTNRVEWTATYSAKTGSLVGPWVAKLYDVQGNFLIETTGTLNVTRMARPKR